MPTQERYSSRPHALGTHALEHAFEIETAAEALVEKLADNTTWTTIQVAAIEDRVLATLAQIKQTLIDLKQLAERGIHQQICQGFNNQKQQLSIEHKQNKQQRDRDRAKYYQQLQGDGLTAALSALTKASQQESRERRRLKQEMARAIAPVTDAIALADQHIHTLKQQYKTISKQWQAHMQLAYSASETKASKTKAPLPVIYQDEHLIVIDKPAGLLSVPGRRYQLQDSVLSRLQRQLLDPTFLQLIHRLDQATSGVLAIALSPAAHRNLSQQFAQHKVHKTYEAILSCSIKRTDGIIDLPLGPNLLDRPKQRIDFQQGKPSRTAFKMLTFNHQPRVRFRPYTGRTHQLRVHAAHPKGLNAPIVGDTLYGSTQQGERLQLHATSLEFCHPTTGKRHKLVSNSPF